MKYGFFPAVDGAPEHVVVPTEPVEVATGADAKGSPADLEVQKSTDPAQYMPTNPKPNPPPLCRGNNRPHTKPTSI